MDKPKLTIVYGKKPRGSKTSKKISYKGMNFFLHQSKAGTRNNIDLYHFEPPYPLIYCFYMSKLHTDKRVTDWIEKRFDDIRERLKDIDENIQIPVEIYTKGT